MMTRIFSGMSPVRTLVSGAAIAVFGMLMLVGGVLEAAVSPVGFVVGKLRKV